MEYLAARRGLLNGIVGAGGGGLRLSERQWLVLALACAHQGGIISESNRMPHGVYRSLVIKGLLAPHRDGYSVTDQGRAAVAHCPVLSAKFRQALLARGELMDAGL
jgi:hypothetical protein